MPHAALWSSRRWHAGAATAIPSAQAPSGVERQWRIAYLGATPGVPLFPPTGARELETLTQRGGFRPLDVVGPLTARRRRVCRGKLLSAPGLDATSVHRP